jgi:hypothetical protein
MSGLADGISDGMTIRRRRRKKKRGDKKVRVSSGGNESRRATDAGDGDGVR